MKKVLILVMAAMMLLTLAACGGNGGTTDPGTDGEPAESYRIAIVKQLDHASLNEISTAIQAQLDVIAAEKNYKIEYTEFNGQNDPTMMNQIGSQIIADEYDAIIPIATTAAQIMITAAEETKTPVIYSAISDPEEAGVTGIDFVTGVSDALDTNMILDMMFAQNPDIKTVGLLYSLSEPNSVTPIAQAKEYLAAKGVEVIEKTGNNNSEITDAALSMYLAADAIFTPTDNVVMAAELTIGELFATGGVPHYTGADSFVRNGAFATCGVSYTALGEYTADLAIQVLETGTFPDFYTMPGGIITVNTEVAELLDVDYSVFHDMGTVFEVITTED